MKTKKLKYSAFIMFSLLILNSCSGQVPTVNNVIGTVNNPFKKTNTAISGKVEFPQDFSAKSTIGDIATLASVAIIYTPDHPTNANKVIATGLTDVSGNFTVNPSDSFSPSVDDIFILQASKRIGGSGNDTMNLSTYIKWTGSSWLSMTFPNLYINTKTTALSIIASYNTETVSASDTIGKINVSTGSSVPLDINPQITSQTVLSVADLVTSVIASDFDPIQYIYFDGSNYLIKPAGGLVKGWNPSSEIIVFQSGSTESTEIMGMYTDGTNLNNISNNPAWDYYPSLSPDRSKILFTSNRDGNAEIYVMDKDGSNVVNLSNNPASDSNASWSHDGNYIVFVSDRDGNQEIYSMLADGSNVLRLTNNSATDSFPKWNHNSTKIAFASDRTGNFDIFTMNPDGGGISQITTFSDFDCFPSWAPDGSKLAYVSKRNSNEEIYTISNSGTFNTRMTNNSDFDSFPSWSPDGSKIIFVSDRDGNNELYTMNSSDGSSLIRITANSSSDTNPDWK